MIRLDHVYAGYSSDFLKDINLTIEKGKITSIIGTNGSGKSTLLKVIANFLKPSKGTIVLNDKNIQDYKLNELAKTMSILPQVRNIPDISCEALVSHGRFPHVGFSRKLSSTDRLHIDNAFQSINIENLRNKNVRDLSGGERQKVFIAMVLAQDTDIILLDEPTTFLDIKYQIEIMELVKKLNEQGKTILMVLHDLNHAINYSDNVIVMKNGQMIANKTPYDLVKADIINQAFDITTKIFEDNDKKYYFFE